MNRLKILSISMVVALLAGVIVFSSCKKDDSSADIGKKAAKEYCDCFKESTAIKFLACAEDWENKYVKYEDDNEFLQALGTYVCNPSKPSWWNDDLFGDWEDWFGFVKMTY